MIIVAVIYGETPSIAIERFVSPPPENKFKKPRSWFEVKS
jgi:hypothetical protein